MSMAASIESRVPFLDHKLVEYTAKLPEKMKIRGRETKWILREAMKRNFAGRDFNALENGFSGSGRKLVSQRISNMLLTNMF